MNKTKKIIALVLALVLVCAGSVFATVAYLTAQDTVENTFTVGNIGITLDETKVNPDGTPVEPEERVEENNYHLVPGSTYTKDPTLTVAKGSEEAYVRMLVQVEALDQLKEALPQEEYYANGIFLLEKLCNYNPESGWIFEGFDEETATYEFRYKEVVDASEAEEDMELAPLFTTITVPGSVTEEGIVGLETVKIRVVGQAIQAANFADEDAAWAAFDVQKAA